LYKETFPRLLRPPPYPVHNPRLLPRAGSPPGSGYQIPHFLLFFFHSSNTSPLSQVPGILVMTRSPISSLSKVSKVLLVIPISMASRGVRPPRTRRRAPISPLISTAFVEISPFWAFRSEERRVGKDRSVK